MFPGRSLEIVGSADHGPPRLEMPLRSDGSADATASTESCRDGTPPAPAGRRRFGGAARRFAAASGRGRSYPEDSGNGVATNHRPTAIPPSFSRDHGVMRRRTPTSAIARTPTRSLCGGFVHRFVPRRDAGGAVAGRISEGWRVCRSRWRRSCRSRSRRSPPWFAPRPSAAPRRPPSPDGRRPPRDPRWPP